MGSRLICPYGYFQRTVLVKDDTVRHLFDFIERPPDDTNDPYHYHAIRALVSFPFTSGPLEDMLIYSYS